MQRRKFLAIVANLAVWPAVVACSAPTSSGLNLTVASSLGSVMQALDKAYQSTKNTPAASIQAGGSGALAQQIIDGAASDVFAAADRASMDKVVAATLIDASTVKVIAHTALVVVIRPGANVPDLAALATAGVKVVMADKTVPAGKYGLTLLDNLAKTYGADYKANVSANVVSYEANVKAVLQKVTNGDADAGIVYASDVIALGDKIQVLTIPTESAVIAEYVAAPLRNAASNAADFVDFITSDSAKIIWQQHGFTV
jgi:molybdate transport system substrate-binding protein